jgi:hypothetical protein
MLMTWKMSDERSARLHLLTMVAEVGDVNTLLNRQPLTDDEQSSWLRELDRIQSAAHRLLEMLEHAQLPRN